MSRCILHVGMHKTGTSSIQQSLHGYSDDRFLCAALGDAGNHSLAIFSLFAPNPERHHLHQASGRSPAAVRAYIAGIHTDLDRAISAAKGRTLLISGEDIGVIPPPGLARMREYFQQRFDDLTIVGYVRTPASFISSGFQQRVRRGLAKLSLEQSYRQYEKSFGKFDEVFGRENVHLWKFDPKTFPKGCAVRDFCSRLGISLPAERIVRLNESFSRQAVSALYTYHTMNRGEKSTMKSWESQKIGALLGGAGSTKFRFSPEAVRPILEKNRPDIEWMAKRLGQSLDEELSGQPGDVRDELDLLKPDPQVVSRILALLQDADAVPPGVNGDTPQQVAMLVHALRKTLKPKDGGQRKNATSRLAPAGKPVRQGDTRVTELIEKIRQVNPKLLEVIPQTRAEALVRNVFKHINSSLAGTEEGVVRYAGLGRFQVRKVDSGVRIKFRRAESDNDNKADGVED